jgi:hypothetical protein
MHPGPLSRASSPSTVFKSAAPLHFTALILNSHLCFQDRHHEGEGAVKDNDCICMKPPFHHADFDSTEIGVDKTHGRFGQVSIETCKRCQRKWLHYLVEYEAFSRSGRWYRGLLSDELAKSVTPETAVEILEDQDWYFYGGSYFQTQGRMGSGRMRVDL